MDVFDIFEQNNLFDKEYFYDILFEALKTRAETSRELPRGIARSADATNEDDQGDTDRNRSVLVAEESNSSHDGGKS